MPMSKKDMLDKKINYLQALQLAFIAILVSLIGYSATHYKEMETFLLIGAIVMSCILVVLNVALTVAIFKIISKMEEL